MCYMLAHVMFMFVCVCVCTEEKKFNNLQQTEEEK